MTTSTPNLALTLYNSTTDSAEYFSNFRAVIAGTSLTSNFYKIDTAYGVQAGQITSLQGTRGAVYVPATYISANYYEASGITDITAYSTNMAIILTLDVASAGTVTLNINALGTKSVTKINSAGTVVNITGAELMIGKNYLFRYDGTQWVWVSSNSADQIYHGGASGNAVLVASDGTPSSSTTTSLLVSNAIFNATEKTTPSDSDTVGISDSDASNVLKKLTWANFKTAIGTSLGAIINALTSKTTPVGADVITVGDSVSSFDSKKVALSNLYKSLGTGTPTSQTALLGDGSWGQVSSFWTTMSGTPTRASNTTFTVTGDITSASPIAKGMVIKWTESAAIKIGMISIPPTYGAPNSTVTIIGDTMASIDSGSLKYAMIDPVKVVLAKAGSVGGVETDAFPSWYAEEPFSVIGVDCYVGTAGTTNATTFDINKNGTTMFTTKPTLASTVAASPTPFTADNATSLALNDKITCDVDAVQTTPAVDAYLKIYVFPTRYLYLS